MRSQSLSPASSVPRAVPALAAALAALAALAPLVSALLPALLAPPPLRADWIVTRDGQKFEIQGAWQVKGKMVVFTLPNGTLSSVRADRVDLDASRRATDEAKKHAAAPAAPRPAKTTRKAVIVLTDKDFKKTALPAAAPGTPGSPGAPGANPVAGATGAKEGAAARDVAPTAVEVVKWDRVPASESKADGLEIVGVVRNASQDLLTEIGVTADLFDDNGALIGRFPATVETQPLPPTETSKFRVVASGVFAFASIRWESQAKGFKTSQQGPVGAQGTQPGTPPPS